MISLSEFPLDNLSQYKKLLILSVDFDQKDYQELLKNPALFKLPTDLRDPYLHSDLLDRIFGYKIDKIELDLLEKAKLKTPNGSIETWGRNYHGFQSWIGLPPHLLQTPYSSLEEMVLKLKHLRFSKIVDLGAAYGRLGIVLSGRRFDCKYLGVEMVPQRAEECRSVFTRLGLDGSSIAEVDMIHRPEELPPADMYFCYHPGNLVEMQNLFRGIGSVVKEYSVVIRTFASAKTIPEKIPPLKLEINMGTDLALFRAKG